MSGDTSSIPLLRVGEKELNEKPQAADDASVKLYNELRPSVVAIEAGKTAGSGFAAGEPGQVITNYHVVADANEVFVRTTDGLRYRARIKKIDDIKDLAVLEIEGKAPDSLKPIKLGDESKLTEKQAVNALGHPDGARTPMFSPGTFTAFGTNFTRLDADQLRGLAQLKLDPGDKAEFLKNPLLEANIQIRHGSSGGPVVSNDGSVVGVSVYRKEPPEMRGFMVPVSDLKALMNKNTDELKYQFNYQYQLSPSLTSDFLGAMHSKPVITTALTGGAVYLGYRAISDLGGIGRGLSGGVAAYGGLGLLDDIATLRDATNNRDLLKAGLSTVGDSSLLVGGIARAIGVGTRTIAPLASSSLLAGAETKLATTIGAGLLGSAERGMLAGTVGLSEKYLTGAGKVGLALIAVGLAAKVASDLVPNRVVNTSVIRLDGAFREPFYLARKSAQP